ncbi:hypothetical protein BH11ACT3_BH11ACT3_15500 [soil metagenome]
MSDDTPTQRFPSAGDGDGNGSGIGETPTERLGTGGAQEDLQEEQKKSRGLLIGLIIAGALLLIAIVVLVVFLVGRASGQPQAGETTTPSATPSASATPSTTPTATPTPTPTPTEDAPPPPPPPSTAPTLQFTTTNTQVLCNASAPAGSHQYIGFSWKSSNVNQVFFGVDTNDASAGAFFSNLPPSGTSTNDFPEGFNHDTFEYACGTAKHTYTMTVVGTNGQKVSKTVTIKNNGDVF